MHRVRKHQTRNIMSTNVSIFFYWKTSLDANIWNHRYTPVYLFACCTNKTWETSRANKHLKHPILKQRTCIQSRVDVLFDGMITCLVNFDIRLFSYFFTLVFIVLLHIFCIICKVATCGLMIERAFPVSNCDTLKMRKHTHTCK